MRRTPPLRIAIPLALGLLGIALAAIAIVHDIATSYRELEETSLRRATFLSHVVVPSLEREILNGETEDAEDEVARLALEPDLTVALVCDPADRVIFSTDYSLRGRLLGTTPGAAAAALVALARSTMTGQAQLSPDGSAVHVALPFHLELQRGELRPSRVGVLYTETDIARSKQQALAAIFGRAALMGAAALVACALAWAYLRVAFTRQLGELVSRVAAYTAGTGELRVPVEGAPELAQIGQVLNALGADLAVQQAALRESEERFRRLFDDAVDPVFVHDVDGHLVDVNTAACASLGYRREELLRLGVADVAVGKTRDQLVATWATLGEGERTTIESVHRRRDGSTFPVEVRVAPHDAGKQRLYFAAVRDITARKRAEASQQRRTAFEAVVTRILARFAMLPTEAIDDGIRKSLEELGHFNGAEQAYLLQLSTDRTTCGITHHWTAPGTPPLDVARYVDRPLAGAEWMLRRLEDGEILALDDLAQLPEEAAASRARLAADGVRSQLTIPLRGGGRSFAGVLGFRTGLRAVTWDLEDFPLLRLVSEAIASALERRTAEAEVRRSHDELVANVEEQQRLQSLLIQSQKMQAVGQLAGGVAHDFNNILTAILMNAALMLEDPYLPLEVRTGLRDLETEAQRAAGLTRQLLMFSRGQPMQVKPLELNSLVGNLLRMLRRVIGEHVALDFIGTAGDLWLDADGGMLEQAVMNLVVNARDAMPQGGRVTLRTRGVDLDTTAVARSPEARAGSFAVLEVIDTGSGMDVGTLERAFEPFFTTKLAGKGTGLGLATVYGIVKQHRGWVEVESTPGQGTLFRLLLPTRPAVADGPEGRVRPGLQGGLLGGSEHLLVVEDEVTVRGLMVRTLEALGYQVAAAASGREALEIWRANGGVDLLLSDMVMPGGMNGLELAQELLAERPGLHAILMSGYSPDLADGEQLRRHGIGFLAKPIDLQVLARTVRETLDGHA